MTCSLVSWRTWHARTLRSSRPRLPAWTQFSLGPRRRELDLESRLPLVAAMSVRTSRVGHRRRALLTNDKIFDEIEGLEVVHW